MKKHFKKVMISFFSLAFILTFTSTFKVNAATGSWHNTTISGCQVRVWTDYSRYTSSATSIDTYAETNGKCGTIDYKAAIYVTGEGRVSSVQSGYFANRTPIKYFYFSNMPNINRGFNIVESHFELYKNGSFIGAASSDTLIVDR
ncbi:hypothetical protein [Fictibacillus sp. 18YEL24]|uniref:hypothetical protein n=1 Tax=Fictibacillus sp. 18YEL24 TaxID=2745875 RepID=UPI0018CEFF14|nr:hypothetical protein [Fictibacillus sp. 18YEL24]MBH0170410.1 hypothetical protein [Fictibacillus sp. 18YEL24]